MSGSPQAMAGLGKLVGGWAPFDFAFPGGYASSRLDRDSKSDVFHRGEVPLKSLKGKLEYAYAPM